MKQIEIWDSIARLKLLARIVINNSTVDVSSSNEEIRSLLKDVDRNNIQEHVDILSKSYYIIHYPISWS
jgi:hypothetical protein